MFKKFFLWTIGFFLFNILLIACGAVQKEFVAPTPSSDLLDLQQDVDIVSFQNSYNGRCVDNANDYVKQFCDSDNDGLLNYQESTRKTDPYDRDTDNDGYNDYEEVERSYDPLSFENLVPEKYKYCEDSNKSWCWQAQAYYKADPTICDKLLVESKNTNSFFNNSNNSSHYDKCVEQAQKAKDEVLKELAIAAWDIDACNEIVNDDIKEACEKDLALILGALNMDADYCLETFGFSEIKKDEIVDHDKSKQHRCWFGMAIATEDVEQCASLDTHIIKDFDAVTCVTKIARLKKNTEICNYLKELGLESAVSICLGESGLPVSD